MRITTGIRTYSRRTFLSLLAGTLGAVLAMSSTARAEPAAPLSGKDLRVFIGTYTSGKSKGIYVGSLDLTTGHLIVRDVGNETTNPSFLAVHPNQRYLYAVNEIDKYRGASSGSVSVFRIEPHAGLLTPISEQASRGGWPAHIVVDRAGRNVIVANYLGGSTAVLPIDKDGRLRPVSAFQQHVGSSVNRSRQEAPHAHGVALDRANRFAYVADLGTDQILIYRYDSKRGTLVPNKPAAATVPAGSGPRHVAIHPNGRTLYCINELLSTVSVFRVDGKSGALSDLQTIATLPTGFTGSSTTAEVVVHPSGKFLYGSNRGHDSIVIYAIDAKTGKLTLVGHESTRGKTPRNFTVDPTGAYLLVANQESSRVVVFRIDPTTGRLTAVGAPVDVPTPVCIEVLPRLP